MFRAAHRSSSGALNCICILWFVYPCGDRPLSRLSGKWLWNNKFYYKLHFVGISTESYYDVRIHEYQTDEIPSSMDIPDDNNNNQCRILV